MLAESQMHWLLLWHANMPMVRHDGPQAPALVLYAHMASALQASTIVYLVHVVSHEPDVPIMQCASALQTASAAAVPEAGYKYGHV